MSYFHTLTKGSVERRGIGKGKELFSYSNSKFCQVCASDLFGQKLMEYGITSNCFHPGAAKTNIYRDALKGANWVEFVTMVYIYCIAFTAGKVSVYLIYIHFSFVNYSRMTIFTNFKFLNITIHRIDYHHPHQLLFSYGARTVCLFKIPIRF